MAQEHPVEIFEIPSGPRFVHTGPRQFMRKRHHDRPPGRPSHEGTIRAWR